MSASVVSLLWMSGRGRRSINHSMHIGSVSCVPGALLHKQRSSWSDPTRRSQSQNRLSESETLVLVDDVTYGISYSIMRD